MTYPGGKGASGVVQTIINQQPPHDTYIEAFLGGGAVMRAKRPARVNIGIDIDPSTIATFRDAGSDAELLCCHATRWLLDKWPTLTGNELIYCDPPYLMETRRNWAKMYRYEMDDNAHAFLLQTIALLPCMVQISGYESRMYAAHLKGWRLVKFQASTRHGMRTECLWMNYPEPTILHDFRYLGSDYRERERIKRKAHRWVSRLDSLPRLEKLAICAELTSSIAEFGDATRPKLPDRALAADIAGYDGASSEMDPIAISAGVGRRLSSDRPVRDRSSAELEVLQ
jgi:DNA adenine methylase